MNAVSSLYMINRRGGDGLAVNKHVCALQARVSLLPRMDILASNMGYGVVRQGFDPGLPVSFVSS
jgi:hypothetical protein